MSGWQTEHDGDGFVASATESLRRARLRFGRRRRREALLGRVYRAAQFVSPATGRMLHRARRLVDPLALLLIPAAIEAFAVLDAPAWLRSPATVPIDGAVAGAQGAVAARLAWLDWPDWLGAWTARLPPAAVLALVAPVVLALGIAMRRRARVDRAGALVLLAAAVVYAEHLLADRGAGLALGAVRLGLWGVVGVTVAVLIVTRVLAGRPG